MWTAEQLARLARLAHEILELPEADREDWLMRIRAQHADLTPAIDSMAESTRRTSLQGSPALTLPPDQDDQMPGMGDDVGPYRLLSPLGQGGMSTVWLAEQMDGRVRRRVALKLIARHLTNAGWRLRFERERDILATLSHPNIARLIDADLTGNGQAYLVMDLIDGENMVQYVTSHALPPRDCVSLVVSLLDAVAYAHEMSIVHRDIKPSNVMVDRRGHVMLLDFGIAKMLQADAGFAVAPEAHLTALYGQPLILEYASPEQVAGRPVGCASDVYSIGVLLFELLAGHRPYIPRGRSRPAVEEAILEQDLQAPSQRVETVWAKRLGLCASDLAQQLRGTLDAIVMKALQREPTQRYASASEFAQDLRRWLEGQAVQAPPVDTSTAALQAPSPLPPPSPAPSQTPSAAPRSPGPSKRIRDQIREHLIPTNTVIVFGMALVTLADLLAPSLIPVAVVVRNVAVALAAGLIMASLWPGGFDRLLILTGLMSPAASTASSSPWWRRIFSRRLLLPAVFVAVALSATLSQAGSGGVIASEVASIRSLQRQLLGLQVEVTAIGSGVAKANVTLDAMAAREQAVQDQMAASPLAIGLLELQGAGLPTQAGGAWPSRLAVYLNAAGYGFDSVQLQIATNGSDGLRRVQNLSPMLGSGSGAGAVQLMLTLPADTRSVSACLVLPAGTERTPRTLTQRWRAAPQPDGLAFQPASPPEVRAGEDSTCAI